MKTFTSCALLALVVGGSVGCSSSALDTGAGTEKDSAVTSAMAMTLLARIERSPTDVVSFYDSEIGIVISETGLAEEAGQHGSLEELRARGMTAAFRTLAKDEKAQVPAALLAAESRWQERRAALLQSPAPAVAPPPGASEGIQKKIVPRHEGANTTVYTGGSVAVPREIRDSVNRAGNGEDIGVKRSALGGSPGDSDWWQSLPICQYADLDSSNRSIAWYDGVWCVTDTTWAQTGWRDTMYYEVTAFGQGDTANVVVNKWIGGAWQAVLNTTVAYRYFQTFSFAPENGAYFYSRVDGTGGENIGISERYRLAMPQPAFLNNKPNDVEYEFANDIQGITHDSNNWYLTRTKYDCPNILACAELDFEPRYGIIAKVPLTTSLDNDISNSHGMPSSWNVAPGGGGLYNHYGDLVHLGGHLYVAMNGDAGAAVGIFDTDLNPITYWPLSQNWDAPAIAYNPQDGLFYVPSDSSHFQKYEIGLSSGATWKGVLTLSQPLGGGVQGAKFSWKGNLWVLVNGAYYGIDGANGALMVSGSISMGDADEGEGLDIFDLDSETRPGMSGQLHFQLLNNNVDDDNWWLMHWQAPIDRL